MPDYRSQLPYNAARIRAAAIYCSDGRVGEHFDDFLQNGLSLPRYDRLALPGGPACIAGHTEAHMEETGIVQELKFLVDVHGLGRVVLIQHEGCAFYAKRLSLPPHFIDAQQRIDLLKAAMFIQKVTGLERVDAYLAKHADGHMSFEEVPLK
jgi:hypothetical protein